MREGGNLIRLKISKLTARHLEQIKFNYQPQTAARGVFLANKDLINFIMFLQNKVKM